MAWTDGVTRATGYLVSAADWNNHHGASGNDMELKLHTHDGTAGDGSTSLGPLVLGDFTDAAAPAAPGAGKTRLYTVAGRPRYRAGAAGADTALFGELGSDADGDMYYRAGGALARLPKGTAAQSLFGGTVPVWANSGTVTILDRIAATTSVVNTAVETSIYSKTVGAGALGATGGLRLFAIGDTLNNTGGAQTVRWRIYFGATIIFDTGTLAVPIGAARYGWDMDLEILNSATNAQRARGTFRLRVTSGDAWAGAFATDFLGYATAAEDTTAAKAVAITAQLSVADVNVDARVKLALLEQFATA